MYSIQAGSRMTGGSTGVLILIDFKYRPHRDGSSIEWMNPMNGYLEPSRYTSIDRGTLATSGLLRRDCPARPCIFVLPFTSSC